MTLKVVCGNQSIMAMVLAALTINNRSETDCMHVPVYSPFQNYNFTYSVICMIQDTQKRVNKEHKLDRKVHKSLKTELGNKTIKLYIIICAKTNIKVFIKT